MGKNSAISWTTHRDLVREMKRSANQAVHLEVRAGVRPHANTIPCSTCGHVWSTGGRRHEWHHHLGHERAHWFDVVVLCTTCHHALSAKAQQTHCIAGHEFNEANTAIQRNGTRRCRACGTRREKERAAQRKAERHARGLRNRWSSRKEQRHG